MKKVSFLILTTFSICLTSWAQKPNNKVELSIQSYLKQNLKNPTSYDPISFGMLRHLKTPDTMLITGKVFYHTMLHTFRVKNSEGIIVPMSVAFAFDNNMNIVATGPENIDGDYTSIKGTVAFGGYKPAEQKPDFNAKIVFFPTDTLRKALTFETTTDMQGNYSLEKILPGQYIVVLRSANAVFCPNLFIFSGQEFERRKYSEHAELIEKLWGFDYRKLEGFKRIEDKEIATNQKIAKLTGTRTPESDKIRQDWRNSRIGFDQECFNFYKSFQSKLPSIFYQFDLEHSNAIKFESYLDVKEEKGQTKNFIISDACY